MISQVQAARLMAAATKWAKAHAARGLTARVGSTAMHVQAYRQDQAAEKAFAELVSKLTESE